MMFEGGSQSSNDEHSEYEGGSEDEELKDEDGAQSIKPKGKKKKSKKTKKADTLKSKLTDVTQKLDESAYNPDTQGDINPLKPADDLVIDDFDNQTQKTKKTKRSVSKKKTIKKKGTGKGTSEVDVSPQKTEEQIVVNEVNLAGFKNAQKQALEPQPE